MLINLLDIFMVSLYMLDIFMASLYMYVIIILQYTYYQPSPGGTTPSSGCTQDPVTSREALEVLGSSDQQCFVTFGDAVSPQVPCVVL